MKKIIKLPLEMPIGQIYEIDGKYYQTIFCDEEAHIACKKCVLGFESELCNKVNISCRNIIFKEIPKYEILFLEEQEKEI